MNSLLETIAAELERPRVVSQQVTRHIVGTYDVPREHIGTFLTERLPALEDYEIDLVLSPLFTPSLQDQSIFAEMLGKDSCPTERWPQMIQHLVCRPTRASLITEDGTTHRIALRDVTIQRFVLRLRLEGAIPDDVFELISRLRQATDRTFAKAIARRAIWDHSGRGGLLRRFLLATAGGFNAADGAAFLKLTETYEPKDTEELLRQIPHWQQVLRQEIDAPGAKPFFNERVEELHGGGRDQRRQDGSRTSTKQIELEFLERLSGYLMERGQSPSTEQR